MTTPAHAMWTIRAARRQDAPALAALAATTFPLACPPGTLPEHIEAHLAEHLDEGFFARAATDASVHLFVAEPPEATALLGYTLTLVVEPDDPRVLTAITAHPTCELSKCYALPSVHGSGVAQALVEAAKAAAVESAARGMWLGVNSFNARAQAFYRKMGFVPVGRRFFRVGEEVHDDLVLEARLDADVGPFARPGALVSSGQAGPSPSKL